jgi:hypothetical protein
MSSHKTISLPVALAGMCICAVSSALAMNFYLESSKRKSTAKKGPKDSMIPSTALYARLLASPYHTPGLFKSLEAAVTVLRIVVEDSDRVTIMEKMQLNQLLSKLQCCNFSSLRAKAAAATSTGSAGESGSGLQVVVLEGLPGCGKSTLAKNLGAQLNAARVYDDDFAYPAELEKLHDIVYSSMTETLVLSMMQGLGEAEKTRFEAKHRHAVAILRAVELIKLYYMMYDIVGQQEVNQAPSGTFVVVNYYHSLCAKALNSELFNMSDAAAGSGVATAPPADANTNEFCEYFNPQAFAWPFDLPKPSLVVYMAVQSQDRLARLGLRVGGVTPTEADAEALDIVKQEKADTKLQVRGIVYYAVLFVSAACAHLCG